MLPVEDDEFLPGCGKLVHGYFSISTQQGPQEFFALVINMHVGLKVWPVLQPHPQRQRTQSLLGGYTNTHCDNSQYKAEQNFKQCVGGDNNSGVVNFFLMQECKTGQGQQK